MNKNKTSKMISLVFGTGNFRFVPFESIKYSYKNFNKLLEFVNEFISNNFKNCFVKKIYTGYRKVIYDSKLSFLLKESLNLIKEDDKLIIHLVCKRNPKSLVETIIQRRSGIEKIGKLKPVASLVGNFIGEFRDQWEFYNEKEKEEFKKELSSILGLKIKVFFNKEKNYEVFFFSPKYLTILNEVYGITMEEAFEILSTHQNMRIPNMGRDFVLIAYGDLMGEQDWHNNVELTEDGSKKLEIYKNLVFDNIIYNNNNNIKNKNNNKIKNKNNINNYNK